MRIYNDLLAGKTKVGLVGLGYVGLPLAVALSQKIDVVGFDIKESRIKQLQEYNDSTKEITEEELKKATRLSFTDDETRLTECNFIIVTVPTPINEAKIPDLTILKSATALVGRNLNKNSIIVFESTVYPSVTEDICVPILEESSGLKYDVDFNVGYSPERINPGDREHTVDKIIKVVSGDKSETLEEVSAVYELVTEAGTYKAESIKCAEAAKVIENTQRDLNIALMNELAIIFDKVGVDTQEVLKAAGTKWNFIKMTPGLVGGHCIGVDPYYLTYKAQSAGYTPRVILAGRNINDSMGKYIAEQTVKKMISAQKLIKGATVVVLGITFKENVTDIRNSRVIDIIDELKQYGLNVVVCDPLADKQEVKEAYGIDLVDLDKLPEACVFVFAVNHDQLKDNVDLTFLKSKFTKNNGKSVLVDVKGVFDPKAVTAEDIIYWRL